MTFKTLIHNDLSKFMIHNKLVLVLGVYPFIITTREFKNGFYDYYMK